MLDEQQVAAVVAAYPWLQPVLSGVGKAMKELVERETAKVDARILALEQRIAELERQREAVA